MQPCTNTNAATSATPSNVVLQPVSVSVTGPLAGSSTAVHSSAMGGGASHTTPQQHVLPANAGEPDRELLHDGVTMATGALARACMAVCRRAGVRGVVVSVHARTRVHGVGRTFQLCAAVCASVRR
jgi:hypothetical protein